MRSGRIRQASTCLVNNAGIQHSRRSDQFPGRKWNAIIRAQLDASFPHVLLALPGMKRTSSADRQHRLTHAVGRDPLQVGLLRGEATAFGPDQDRSALRSGRARHHTEPICPVYVGTPLVEKQIPYTAKARGLTEQPVIHDVPLAAQPTKQVRAVDEWQR